MLFPVSTLIDSWITQVARRNPAVSYGVTRAMGSLGFAVTLMFAGRAFDAYGIGNLFLAYGAILLLLLPVVAVQGALFPHELGAIRAARRRPYARRGFAPLRKHPSMRRRAAPSP